MSIHSNYRLKQAQRGFALPAVLFVMAILGVLAVGSMMTTGDDRQAANGVREGTRAFYAAEAGLNAVLANWATAEYDTLITETGGTLDLGAATLPENGTTYRARIRRIDDGTGDHLYTLAVRGEAGPVATSSASIIIKKPNTWTLGTAQAAITAGIGLRKNSSNGMNTGFDACGGGPLAGLQVAEDELEYDGPVTDVFDGTPPVEEVDDPVQEWTDAGIDWAAILAGDFTYTIFDELTFPDFSTLPLDFYPSILVTGPRIDVNAAQSGRGLLVVTEELRINNDWVWDGVILVGNFFQSNGKMTITGMISSGLDLQLGRDEDDMSISAIGPGEAQVTYDSCIVANVQNGDGGSGYGTVELVAGSWLAAW